MQTNFDKKILKNNFSEKFSKRILPRTKFSNKLFEFLKKKFIKISLQKSLKIKAFKNFPQQKISK